MPSQSLPPGWTVVVRDDSSLAKSYKVYVNHATGQKAKSVPAAWRKHGSVAPAACVPSVDEPVDDNEQSLCLPLPKFFVLEASPPSGGGDKLGLNEYELCRINDAPPPWRWLSWIFVPSARDSRELLPLWPLPCDVATVGSFAQSLAPYHFQVNMMRPSSAFDESVAPSGARLVERDLFEKEVGQVPFRRGRVWFSFVRT